MDWTVEACFLTASMEEEASQGHARGAGESVDLRVPVILCSGLEDDEVRAVARTLIPLAWEEHGVRCAIAKAVPPAMQKPLRQLLGELGGDHEDALRVLEARRENEQEEEGGAP
mmetsp:Transcript_806/g.2579  ORF Transcript_806/g.2579 Transcript_806/m.2579 type:complete len:114 (+) Transcript_806:2-343(+)